MLERYYKRMNIYLKCYLYFIELAEKDHRRPIMSEGLRQAGSHPTTHKGRCLDRWFNDSNMCRGARDQVEIFCIQGTAWVGKKCDAMPAFSLAYSLMVSVPLVLILTGLLLIVKAGVMPAFSRTKSLLGWINSSDLHWAPATHLTTSLRRSLNKCCCV